MLGTPVAAGVWQTGTSGPKNGGDMSTAVARAPATMFPASSIASAVPPSAAAPTETSSLCDRVNVAMSYSKIGGGKNLPNLRSNGRTEPGSNEDPSTRILRLFRPFCKTIAMLAHVTPSRQRLHARTETCPRTRCRQLGIPAPASIKILSTRGSSNKQTVYFFFT
jgi:hypothetical protein